MKKIGIAILSLALAIPVAARLLSIFAIAQEDGRFTTLVAALKIAGLDSNLNCSINCRSFTAVAPTDNAFALLDKALVTKLTTNKEYLEHLKQLLLYHVIPGRILSGAINNGASIHTLQGEAIKATKVNGKITLNGSANVVVANIVATNGVVHAIDKVLIPSFLKKDLVAVAASTTNFKTLVAAVSAVPGLVNVLKTGPFTIFAPSDAAFAKLGTSTINSLLADPSGRLAEILKYHVVPGIVTKQELKGGYIPTVFGPSIKVDISSSGSFLNGVSKIGAANILASNGVIHVIDTVLIPPPKNLANTLIDKGFSSLVAAAKKAGLVSTLSTGGPFTIFAPTNAAFAKLGDISSLSPAALKNILLYHVIPGRVLAKDLKVGAVKTVQGTTIHVNIAVSTVNGTRVTTVTLDGGSKVINTDTIAMNGVIHAINKVLMP